MHFKIIYVGLWLQCTQDSLCATVEHCVFQGIEPKLCTRQTIQKLPPKVMLRR